MSLASRAQEAWERWKRFIAKDDMSDYVEPPGLGIAWLWKLPSSHPFHWAAVWHDYEYTLMELELSPYETSEIPDRHFHEECLAECAKMWWPRRAYYRQQAELFYGLVRVWGEYRWRAAPRGRARLRVLKEEPVVCLEAPQLRLEAPKIEEVETS